MNIFFFPFYYLFIFKYNRLYKYSKLRSVITNNNNENNNNNKTKKNTLYISKKNINNFINNIIDQNNDYKNNYFNYLAINYENNTNTNKNNYYLKLTGIDYTHNKNNHIKNDKILYEINKNFYLLKQYNFLINNKTSINKILIANEYLLMNTSKYKSNIKNGKLLDDWNF